MLAGYDATDGTALGCVRCGVCPKSEIVSFAGKRKQRRRW
jgi:hypothetical protein